MNFDNGYGSTWTPEIGRRREEERRYLAMTFQERKAIRIARARLAAAREAKHE